MKRLIDITYVNLIKKRFARGNKEKPNKETILTIKDGKVKKIFFEDGVIVDEKDQSAKKGSTAR